MKLITEYTESSLECLVEKKENGEKDYSIQGIFAQTNKKNRNGRIYPQEVLEKEVRRYNKDQINNNRAYGELGHPEGPTINLERASHMITKLYPDGKNFIGEAKLVADLIHTNIFISSDTDIQFKLTAGDNVALESLELFIIEPSASLSIAASNQWVYVEADVVGHDEYELEGANSLLSTNWHSIDTFTTSTNWVFLQYDLSYFYRLIP